MPDHRDIYCSLIRFKSADDASFWRAALMIWKDYAIDYGSSCLIKYHEPYMHLSGTFFPSAGIVDADYGADDDSPVGVNVSKVLAPL